MKTQYFALVSSASLLTGSLLTGCAVYPAYPVGEPVAYSVPCSYQVLPDAGSVGTVPGPVQCPPAYVNAYGPSYAYPVYPGYYGYSGFAGFYGHRYYARPGFRRPLGSGSHWGSPGSSGHHYGGGHRGGH